MIHKYIKERLSWILLFIFLQLLIIAVAYLDPAIPMEPILYIIFLSLIIFIFFFLIRYHKETKFFKSIDEWDSHLDTSVLTPAATPFETIVEQKMIEQTARLKRDIAKDRVTMEQEKDELLAWIHEVKTPLTAMSLMIDRMTDHSVKAQLTYEWLRIHLLLDQQLHQKRIPFMENDLYIEKTDLQQLIFKEIKSLRSWCIQKGIGFEVELEKSEVLTDAKWLSFIMRQLLTNAIKYSDSSDIVIKSCMDNEQVKLSIQDSGRGIEAKDLPRIFEKGFTSTTVHQDHAATGMGLYLVKKAAKPLVIHIAVASKPGLGTTFTLTFPKRNEFVNITGM
ncbi:sensor histidine kinase [Niallia endozanthoxylica]|uniref:histidine kinase n=1 Tax=Niallia endozanthoxylica TaxID=2036016 RepID=A0A5J5I1D7_9BACI|nr:sensor histidine kinase [Niallia endozanthoxylica]KAA9028405.1 HAMP domain-containing histidine kinase [Niallia endozanthoxylica]